MAIATPPPTKASTKSTPKAASPRIAFSLTGPDLLAGLRWTGWHSAAAIVALVAIDVFAGWSYLASYFGYFRIPIEGLGLSVGDIVAQGARSMLLPLTLVPVAFVAGAPGRKLGQGALAVAVYILFLAYVAFANHIVSPPSVVVQSAASIAIAGLVFALRRGFGGTSLQRLIIAAVALLILTSIPVASATLDASQKASTKQTTLKIVTRDAILPGSVGSAGVFSYSSYVLLRESDSRYWLLRVGDQYAYSIAKANVLYIRY